MLIRIAREAPDHQHDGGSVKEGSRTFVGRLEVLGQPAAAPEPRESPLRDSSARQDDEADLIGDLTHDFHTDGLNRLRHTVMVITAIGIDL